MHEPCKRTCTYKALLRFDLPAPHRAESG